MQEEIQGEYQDWLDELSGIYGEAYLIKYLSESLIDKEQIIINHEKNN